MFSKLNLLSMFNTQNSEVTKQNDKVQKEINEARVALEKKLDEGEQIWKNTRKKIDEIKIQSTAVFGKDLIKFISSLG